VIKTFPYLSAPLFRWLGIASVLWCSQIYRCHAQSSALGQNQGRTGASVGARDASATYTLKREDVLSISFPLSPEFNETVTIMPDGFINLQLVKSVFVEDLTLPDAARAVKTAYIGVLHDPIVSIDVKSFQQPYFTVLGQVGRPGKYDLRQNTSVPEAIAIAGGFASTAKTQVFLIRRVSGETAEVIPYQLSNFLEGKPNAIEPIDLKPGDMVFVPEKFITKFKKYVTYGGVGGLNAASLY
jgi:polysaccharide biosynthesis/export protein